MKKKYSFRDIENSFKARYITQIFGYWEVAKILVYIFANFFREITPNQLTIISILLLMPFLYFSYTGKFLVAGFFYYLFYTFDIVDGALARLTNSKTKKGAFLDRICNWLWNIGSILSLFFFFRFYKNFHYLFDIFVMLYLFYLILRHLSFQTIESKVMKILNIKRNGKVYRVIPTPQDVFVILFSIGYIFFEVLGNQYFLFLIKLSIVYFSLLCIFLIVKIMKYISNLKYD